MLKWFAPILSFTTEEIFTLINKDKKSIHLEKFIEIPESYSNQKLNKKWVDLKKIRDVCNISIEEKRASKEIGSSLEADLEIELGKKLYELTLDTDFAELCITSKSSVKQIDNEEIVVNTNKAKGKKCSICWKMKIKPCDRSSCPI